MNLSLDIGSDSSNAMNDSADTSATVGQVYELANHRRRPKPLLKAPVDLYGIDITLPPKHKESTLGNAIAAHMGLSSRDGCIETECIIIPRDGVTPLVGIDDKPILSPIKVDRAVLFDIVVNSRNHGIARVDDARWMIYSMGDAIAIGDMRARKGYEIEIVRKGTPRNVSASYVTVTKEVGEHFEFDVIVNETTGEVFNDLDSGENYRSRYASMDEFTAAMVARGYTDLPGPIATSPVLAPIPAAPSEGGVSGKVDTSDEQPEHGTMDDVFDTYGEKPIPKRVRISLDIEVDANTAHKLYDMYIWSLVQVSRLGGELTMDAFLRKTFADAAKALEEERVPFALKAK